MIQEKQTRSPKELFTQYQKVRNTTLEICHPLEKEDYVVQPIMDVSPPKWHLGHTTWFFENFILREKLDGYQLFDARLNWFFNSYYESQGPRTQRSQRGNMSRPTLDTILEYRIYVDQHMRTFLEGNDQLSAEDRLVLQVGLNHEQQHQELLVTDLKFILGNNPLFPVYKAHNQKPASSEGLAQEWLEVAAGMYPIGYGGNDFCWDNELNPHEVYLPDFAIASRLVTNGEYLEFMEAGGYEQHEWWHSEGWEWANSLESKAPLYWYEVEGEWHHYTLSGFEKIDLHLPVTHISFFEASAYAQWKGFRLPTEFEWEAAVKQYAPSQPVDANFLEKKHFHPQQPTEKSYQFWGNCWEWTGSAYLPYPDYPRFKGALGEYNGKFMVNQMVLRGGSCATPDSHIRLSYRNFFHPDKQWQFTGIRLARS